MKRFTVRKSKAGTAFATSRHCRYFVHNTRMISFVKLFGIGMFIGIANVVPGVSGGTIAVVCNVYDKLIALSSLNMRVIRNSWKDFCALGGGLLTGIILFAKMITLLYRLYPAQTSFFFIGVILGSLPFLYKKMQEALTASTALHEKMNVRSIAAGIYGIAGLALMIGIFLLQRRGIGTSSSVMHSSVTTAVILAGSGILAAFAMLIPGISGSFVLLVLGTYQTIFSAVSDFNIPLLIPAAAGIIIGLVLGARFIAFLLNRFPVAVYAFILGLVAGSVIYLYPRVCQPFRLRLVSAAFLCAGYWGVSVFSGSRRTIRPNDE